ncbi:MAG TPA: hypothetical protein PKA58_29800 [Polyangium sp.]|jgi:hypothetical protein|nr:hypothetical protein [Polyangium sp.]
MSGDDAKHELEANASDETQDPLGTGDDVTDEEAERLANEADAWLAEEDKTNGAKTSAEEGEVPLDEVEMRDILRRALRPPPGSVAPELLGGVQKKLRTRSKGKFYGDGWSTARSPRSTYLVTSLLMLVLLGFVFLILLPWGGGALP